MSRLEKLTYDFLNQTIYRRITNDGMQIYYIPKEGFHELTGILSVRYGSLDSVYYRNEDLITTPEGIAHFLEHQLFELEGSEDVSITFSRFGAESNAFTGFESTAYYFSTTDHFEVSLDLLLEFTSRLQISSDTVKKEQGIISQEIDMYQHDPDALLFSGVLSGLFPDTPLAVDVAGTSESIQRITEDQLAQQFKTFYRPDFKTLILIGDFELKLIDRLVRKYERAKRKTLPQIKRLSITSELPIKRQTIQKDVVIPKLAFGYSGYLLPEFSLLEQKIALRLLLTMLFGWTSDWYQKWYDKGKIDDSFDIEIEVSDRFNFVVLMMDTMEPLAMVTQIRKVLKNIRESSDVSLQHLNLVKNEFYGEFIKSLDAVEDLGNQFLLYLDEDQTYFDIPTVLEKLTLETILVIGEAYFKESQQAEYVIFPK